MAVRGDTEPVGRVYGGRSAHQRAGERRLRLIDAALELYGDQGYGSTPIEQLCSVANVSTRSFYEEMGSREKLLIALADDITTRAAAEAVEALSASADEPLPTRIARGFRAYLEVTCRDRRSARVCYVEVVGVSAVVEQWRLMWHARIGDLFVDEVARAVEHGEATDRDYRLFAIAVVGAVNSLAQELALAETSDGKTPSLDEIAFFVRSGLTRS